MDQIRKNSPTGCAGCPCDCSGCVFGKAEKPDTAEAPRIILGEEEYGCRFGGELIVIGKRTGLLRSERFHPLTADGLDFMRASRNPLLDLIAV